ncbi:hypothetical protein ANO11243_003630 [Dothideomycetidae sp. 11243]|nr:hypothetical protein ANO11243_003630 [fungal sp. No.11243]
MFDFGELSLTDVVGIRELRYVQAVSVAQHVAFFLALDRGLGTDLSISSSAQRETVFKVAEWKAIFVLDVITEAALASVPIFFVLGILKKSNQKLIVCSVFLGRLPALNLSHRYDMSEHPDQAGIELMYCEMALEILLAWSIVSASIPALKSLVQPFDVIRNIEGYGYGNRSKSTVGPGNRQVRAHAGFFYGA